MMRPFARRDVARVFKAYPESMRRRLMRLRPTQYAMYFRCRTSLMDNFRAAFPDTFTFEGNRAIVFDAGDRVPVRELAVCISTALTYHRKTSRGRSRNRRA
jgi:hypothetical protein